MTTYSLIEADRSGNSYTLLSSPSFDYVCRQMVRARQMRPCNYFGIVCPDRVDLDWEDGLTEEEREMLP